MCELVLSTFLFSTFSFTKDAAKPVAFMAL